MIPLSDVSVLLWPFVAALLLVGILGYLGVHVLARKVIFVDLAMAQIAALGSAAAMLYGHEPGDPATWLLSLLFTLAGAAVFAVTRTRHEKIPHEAVIGLVYAIATAAGILLADRSPHGAEEMKGLLQGSIVWVTPRQIAPAAAVIAAVAAFQFAFRRRFLLISFDPERARAEGINVRLWDFLFYLSFGFVITSSVPIAGVLLVFCFLIAPAVAASLFAEGLRARVLIGWVVGAVVSAVGLLFSYDRPSGPTILVAFAVFLTVIAVGSAVRRAQHRLRAALVVAGAAALLGVGAQATVGLLEAEADPHLDHAAPPRPDTALAALADEHPNVRQDAARKLGEAGRRDAVPALVALLLDRDGGVREAAAGALARLHATEAIPALEKALTLPSDGDWAPLAAADALVDLGAPSGVDALFRIAREGEVRKVREAAATHLRQVLPAEAGVPEDPKQGLDASEAWWEANAPSLVFDAARHVYAPKAGR